MMKVIVLVLGLLAIAAKAFAAGDPSESHPHVVDLTTDNFDKEINGAKAALIEFYAPWCGHCKHLAPQYAKLGEAVANDPVLKNRVVIAKVNADEHHTIGERFGIQGFPTLKFFARGQPANQDTAVDYQEARNAETMIAYLRARIDEDKGFARIDSLNAVVEAFLAAKDKAAAVADVRAAAEKLTGDSEEAAHASVYVKIAEKVAEKGESYLSKEKARVEKLLSSKSVGAAKSTELSKKVAILGHYLQE